jgi:integrase
VKTRYKGVTVNPDRHGKLRARYRRHGLSVYMKTLPDQPGFDAEYKALLTVKVDTVDRHIPGSVNDLVTRYYKSADFAAKGGALDKARRRGLIESFRADYGNDLVENFEFEHIEAILITRTEKRVNDKGRVVGGHVAAMALRKQLRRLFAYARKLKWITGNPVEEAERVGKNKLTGFHTWTEAEIKRYKARHKFGTKARLALEIVLWTGQRRGDARLFGPKHVPNGRIKFSVGKTERDHWLPMAPDLKQAIDAMPVVGATTYLVTEYGKPFTKDGFGNKMREWCDQAGLPHCTLHGLRKALGRRSAESEATQQQIKAVGGWKGDAEVATYTADAQQELLADAGLGRVISKFSDSKDSENG